MSGIGALASGAQIYYGLKQNSEAGKIEKSNIRPFEGVQPEFQQNVNTAQQMAQEGIPAEQYNNAVNGLNRNRASALMSLNNSANPGAGLASIVRAGNDAQSNLTAQDMAARNRNTLALLQQRGILGNQKQRAWQYNFADKYSENLAKSQALRGAGTQNIIGGLQAGAQNAQQDEQQFFGLLGSAGSSVTGGGGSGGSGAGAGALMALL